MLLCSADAAALLWACVQNVIWQPQPQPQSWLLAAAAAAAAARACPAVAATWLAACSMVHSQRRCRGIVPLLSVYSPAACKFAEVPLAQKSFAQKSFFNNICAHDTRLLLTCATTSMPVRPHPDQQGDLGSAEACGAIHCLGLPQPEEREGAHLQARVCQGQQQPHPTHRQQVRWAEGQPVWERGASAPARG